MDQEPTTAQAAGPGTKVEGGNNKAPSTQPKKYRKYCWTSYVIEGELSFLADELHTYVVYGDEICPKTGTPHRQGYTIWKNARSYESIIKKYPGFHWIHTKGNEESNFNYCTKDKVFYEFGTRPVGQGDRTDIRTIRNAVIEGVSDRDIIMDPVLGNSWLRTYRGVQAMRSIIFEEKRNWVMDVRIYWGKPETGKSRSVWDEFGIDNVYAKPPGKWWDGYQGQETVLIDDFDTDDMFDLIYSFYLKLLDRYPMRIEWKGGSGEFYSKRIVFTSNFDPSLWFEHRKNRDAFFRRISEIRYFE